jgi:hypothetical protein
MLVMVAVSMVALGLRVFRRAQPSGSSLSRAARASLSGGLVLFCVVSLTIWFLMGPHPRFGSAALHALTITPGLLVFAPLAGKARLEPRRWRLVALSGLVLVSLVSIELAAQALPRSIDRTALFSFRLGTPSVEVVPNQNFGVRPRQGDQCWITSSPCSPFDRRISVGKRGRWMIMEPLGRTE